MWVALGALHFGVLYMLLRCSKLAATITAFGAKAWPFLCRVVMPSGLRCLGDVKPPLLQTGTLACGNSQCTMACAEVRHAMLCAKAMPRDAGGPVNHAASVG